METESSLRNVVLKNKQDGVFRSKNVIFMLGYELNDRENTVQFQTRARGSLLYSAKTVPGAQIYSYPMATEGDFPGIKVAEREADHHVHYMTTLRLYAPLPPLLFTSSGRGAYLSARLNFTRIFPSWEMCSYNFILRKIIYAIQKE
jgi:hypothetical protein